MAADGGGIWRTVAKNSPRVVAAVKELDAFLKEHPGIPTWLRDQADTMRKRLIAVQQRRGDAARIRGILDIVRSEAHELGRHEGGGAIDTAAWIGRADNIERRVRLAENQDRSDQRKTLARLRAEAGALLADLIEAVARTQFPPGAAALEDDPGPQPPPADDE
jgi:hypothetical protein